MTSGGGRWNNLLRRITLRRLVFFRLLRLDAQAFHSSWVRLQNLELEPARMAEDFAPGGDSSCHLEDEAGQRVGFFVVLVGEKIDAEQLLEPGDIDAAQGDI